MKHAFDTDTVNQDIVINYKLVPVFSDGSTPKWTDESKGICEHKNVVDTLVFYNNTSEGVTAFYMGPKEFLRLAEKIKSINNTIIESEYNPELPF